LCRVEEIPQEQIAELFREHWGSRKVVISSGVYDCAELDGFAALEDDGTIIGLITYVIRAAECEIISLNSLVEGKGIGTRLINEVEDVARTNGCEVLKVTTTNDNLHALEFYQKRGFVLSRVIPNAV